MAKPGAASPSRDLQYLRVALHREFDGLIDMSDFTHPDPGEQERKFLSRALASLVARKISGESPEEAVRYLVDGRHDMGIDAVVPFNEGLHVYFIQSKWKDKGTAGFTADDVRAFFDGFQLLEAQKFDRFNPSLRRYAEQIKQAPWHPQSRIVFVVALAGESKLHPDVVQKFEDFQDSFGTMRNFVSYEVVGLREINDFIREDLADSTVDLVAEMVEQWFQHSQPYDAYQGRVSAVEVAEWYAAHGRLLFTENIRQPLGLTEVNSGLVTTLLEDPESFWYRNNGMTLLCESIDVHHWNRTAYGPVKLELKGASVINGAQTAMAIHEAWRKDPDAVARAYVGMKVISTKNCPEDFGRIVTMATNTQNRVGRRELVVALDPQQNEIRSDFANHGMKYTFKSGENPPTAEEGCSVEEAAIALACAHSKADLAVQSKRDTDLLWESITYAQLFGDQPTAMQIWRRVVAVREVKAALRAWRSVREGRARIIAEHGDHLIAHVICQILADEFEGTGQEWETTKDRIPELTEQALSWLIHEIDRTYGESSIISSTLTNKDRYRHLAKAVTTILINKQSTPDLPPDYRPVTAPRPSRRPNAVPTIIDSRRLADGSALTYSPAGQRERESLGDWLVEDPRRSSATWVNNRKKALIWAVDGGRYSPSGLITKIWEEAGWEDHPVAVQGPSRWRLSDGRSLWELALEIFDENDSAEDEDTED